mgnify:CR=1 FL=1
MMVVMRCWRRDGDVMAISASMVMLTSAMAMLSSLMVVVMMCDAMMKILTCGDVGDGTVMLMQAGIAKMMMRRCRWRWRW